jgi:hypothetical protein
MESNSTSGDRAANATAMLDDEGLTRRFLAAKAIAVEAGHLALRLLADPASLDVQLKGPQDFVTAADRAVERLIAERLAAAFPDDAFLGEEFGSSAERPEAAALWVVDPIDGTSNFARARAEWVISIGLIRDGRPDIGGLAEWFPNPGRFTKKKNNDKGEADLEVIDPAEADPGPPSDQTQSPSSVHGLLSGRPRCAGLAS